MSSTIILHHLEYLSNELMSIHNRLISTMPPVAYEFSNLSCRVRDIINLVGTMQSLAISNGTTTEANTINLGRKLDGLPPIDFSLKPLGYRGKEVQPLPNRSEDTRKLFQPEFRAITAGFVEKGYKLLRFDVFLDEQISHYPVVSVELGYVNNRGFGIRFSGTDSQGFFSFVTQHSSFTYFTPTHGHIDCEYLSTTLNNGVNVDARFLKDEIFPKILEQCGFKILESMDLDSEFREHLRVAIEKRQSDPVVRLKDSWQISSSYVYFYLDDDIKTDCFSIEMAPDKENVSENGWYSDVKFTLGDRNYKSKELRLLINESDSYYSGSNNRINLNDLNPVIQKRIYPRLKEMAETAVEKWSEAFRRTEPDDDDD